jgi:predicted ester cyclase
MGVPHGGKSFRIMSIDVYTIRDGKIAQSCRVEDRAGAMRQRVAQ